MMKRLWMVCLTGLLLAGCTRQPAMETVSDEILVPAMASPAQVTVWLPEEAAQPVLEGEGQRLYLCEDYEILLETRSSGDLRETLRQMTGFPEENLTVIKTMQGSVKRSEFVWTCAGEAGQQLGRGVVLDDGSYHYCLSLLGDGEKPAPDDWQKISGSFALG